MGFSGDRLPLSSRPTLEANLAHLNGSGFGDLSANSGNSALTRDPSFTADFLKRHKEKLLFGSDCSCKDGHGAGISQGGNPGAARLAGKCVARETLTVLKANTTPELFHRLVWINGQRVYKLST